jgi:lipooligosaccharide transport system permease protein
MATIVYPAAGAGLRARFGQPHLVALRNIMVHRHRWTILAFGVMEPVLYLMSIGVGVGRMIGHISGLGAGVTYPQFIAPGLMAMAAMNGAMGATSQAVFVRLRFENTYRVMLTTPLTPRDIALGETGWAVLRGAIESVGFLAVVAVAGLVRSPWGLLAVPAAVIVGFAFASAGLLVATYLRDWTDFQMIQLILLPMFLFATTFYPLHVYPVAIQDVVRVLPLYQSINLLREPMLGEVGMDLVVPLVYLIALGAACLFVAERRMRRQLDR